MRVTLFVFLAACGPSTSASDGGATDGATGNQCTSDVSNVIATGCTRCWPASKALCTQGRPAVVDGMLRCLTMYGTMMANTCWDLFDPNTAGPCMQGVIDAASDATVKNVQMKMMQNGCRSYEILGATALAAMMSDADRTKYGACVANLTTCKVDPCLMGTSFDPSLCMN